MYITPLFFPNLLKLQRNSFITFLEYGIKRELNKINFISNKKSNILLNFYPKLYQLSLPIYHCNECILDTKTYACELNIPVKIKKNSNVIVGWVNLTKLPLMTNKCHFILNGSPRIIMSQITRSPGIYFHRKNSLNIIKSDAYYADIIADRGNWLRLEIDFKNRIWIKIKRLPKIPALLFLQALGLKKSTIKSFIKFPFLKYTDKIFFYSQNSALKEMNKFYRSDLKKHSFASWNKSKITIFERFFSSKYYNLSRTGRVQMNKRLQSYNNINDLTLNSLDLILGINSLLKLQNQIIDIDDIDNFKNKRVKISGELLQSQFSVGILRLEKYLKERINNSQINYGINNLISSRPLSSAITEFFGINPLSQFMDEINPLAMITHKRRLSSLGFGGINRDTATLTVRSIHPTLYGRVCPIETPEGKNAGLVNSFSLLANLNDEGVIQTPFLKTHNGRIFYETGINYISSDQEDINHIVSCDLLPSRTGFLPIKRLPVRIKQQLKEIYSKQIELISLSRIQMLSIATSLIPFLEHNDANRVLMGSNMQRQAVPLIKPECSLVGTGLEFKIIQDLEEGIKASSDGIISYVSSKRVILYTFIKKFKKFEHHQENKTKILYDSLNIKKVFSKFDNIKHKIYPLLKKKKRLLKFDIYSSLIQYQTQYYSLQSYKYSNQGTCTINQIRNCEGEWVLKNSLLSNGLSTYKNELSLGQNLFVAYISWKGYNFEDAVVLSERLVTEHIYTSTHIEKFNVEIKKDKTNIETLTPHIKGITINQKNKLDRNGIIKVGSRVYSNDILVGKIVLIKSVTFSPYRKLLYEILQQSANNIKDNSVRVPRYKQGRITFVDYQYDNFNLFNFKSVESLQMLKIHFMQNRLVQIGDKISGRHGNKGVISTILSIIDMPYLIDGQPIDIILNPLGVPSRMNIGQVLECLIGFCGSHMKKRFKIVPFDEAFGFESSRNLVYSQYYLCTKKTGNYWIFDVNYPGKNRLIDAYSGNYFDQPITIGKAYILKLIHLVEEKIHARSTGPYSLVTQQPLKGKSKKGGQRVGEMEVWAIEGYGAAYTLHELLTIKSDDVRSRQKLVTSILNSNSINFSTAETFKVLTRELQSLCLNLQFFK